jgi:membrane protease YdiL (CAAX protease family)
MERQEIQFEQLDLSQFPDDDREQERLSLLRSFNKLGLQFSLFVLIVNVLSLVLSQFLKPLIGSNADLDLLLTQLISSAPMYLIAFPLFVLYTGSIGDLRSHRFFDQKYSPSPKEFLLWALLVLSALYVSNYLSIFVTGIIGLLRSSPLTNLVERSFSLNTPFQLLSSFFFGVILAPLVEEIMLRGIVLNRLRKYGDVFAVLFSSFIFALLHCNIAQIIYAFLPACVFGYVFLKTGTLKYTILLHMLANFFGMMAIPLLAASENIILVALAGLLVMAISIFGLVSFLLLYNKLKIPCYQSLLPNKKKFSLCFRAPGMLLYMLLVLSLTIYILIVA